MLVGHLARLKRCLLHSVWTISPVVATMSSRRDDSVLGPVFDTPAELTVMDLNIAVTIQMLASTALYLTCL